MNLIFEKLRNEYFVEECATVAYTSQKQDSTKASLRREVARRKE